MPLRAGALVLALLLAGAAGRPAGAIPQADPPVRLATPHAHAAIAPRGEDVRPTADELALRALLARYAAGDVAGAVEGVRARPARWAGEVVEAAIARVDADLKFHQRPQNWPGSAEFARVTRELRGDRLRLLQLTAALAVDATLADTAIDDVGWRILGGERAVGHLFRLRADIQREGPLPWPVVDAFAAAWYHAAIARLQQLVEMTLGPALVARGLTHWPDDPDLLLADGSYTETRVALGRVETSLENTIWPVGNRRHWRLQLTAAAGTYTRAARLSTASREVPIRLARVRLLDGDLRAARELLDGVLAADAPDELHYLARLFRARAAEQGRNRVSAAADYEAARRLRPDATTPLIALSRLADEGGRLDEARTWADRALAAAPGAADPWRSYIEGQGWTLQARLARLRRLGEP
jgi:tetratricopeptide (TPR) repeat protein